MSNVVEMLKEVVRILEEKEKKGKGCKGIKPESGRCL